MAQPWYRKATVQAAVAAGILALIAAIVGPIVAEWFHSSESTSGRAAAISSNDERSGVAESPCSNPIQFTQERFRPTNPPYPSFFVYGSRVTVPLDGSEDQRCRLRVFAAATIESMDIKPIGKDGISTSGSGRARDIETSCSPLGKPELSILILGTSPTSIVCIDKLPG
jgi:hypothetical protein